MATNITLKKITNADGTAEDLHPTTDWSQIESKPGTFAPTGHPHGNITNGGEINTTATIASGDRLVIADSGSDNELNASTLTFGTGTTTFLRNDGTWGTPAGTSDTNNYLTGVSGSGDGTVTFTRSGLSNLTWNAAHTHSEYLLKAGDTMTGDLTLQKDGTTSNIGSHGILFQANSSLVGSGGSGDYTTELNMDYLGNLKFGGNTIFHAGNDGAASGLHADLLDGQQGSYYLNYDNFTNTPTIPTDTNNYLTGVSGSGDGTVTFTRSGLSNITWDASHSHSEYLPLSGGTMTGELIIDNSTANRIRLYTEQGTSQIADTFTDTSTFKSYIYFDQGTSSNDPGFIMHETSDRSSSPDERNEGVLHLVPSDDNSYGDYVSIHGTNDPDKIKLHTDGTIEGVSNLTLSGNITVGGTVDGVDIAALNTTVSGKANTASPAFTGTPTAPTAAANTNTTQIATTAYVQQEITDLIGGAPGALDTLNELAAAINDDSSYASTITTALAAKAPLASPSFTGNVSMSGGLEISGDLEVVGNSIGFIDTNFDAKIEVSDSNPNGTGAVFNFYGDGVSRNATLSAEQFDGNALTASSAAKWTTARTITLGGDLTGNVSLDGSANVTLTAAVSDDSHNHTIANVDGLQSALDGKASSGHTHSNLVSVSGDTMTGDLTMQKDGTTNVGSHGIVFQANTSLGSVGDFTRELNIDSAGNLVYNGNTIFHEGNDGSASGLHADLLDGQQGSYYLNYNNLSNTPTLITNNNQLTNGAGYVTANTQLSNEQVQDIVGAMVSSNSESGISVTYQDTDGTLDFNVNDPTITLTGDVTGSATMTNLGNVSITTTVGNDSHTHDGRYYTESEVDTLLAGKASSSHNHSASEIVTGNFNTARLGSGTATSGYVLKSDGDGTASWQQDNNTTYSLGSFGVTATAAELNKMDGVTATTTELNYTDGVTSNIQTQLNSKLSTSAAAAAVTYTTSCPTANNSTGMKVYVGSTDCSTKYTGWLYIVT